MSVPLSIIGALVAPPEPMLDSQRMGCSDIAAKGLRAAIATAVACGVCAPTLAADQAVVAAPTFTVGDAWVYERTQDQGTGPARQRVALVVERIDSDAMLLGVTLDGGRTSHNLVGLDWSHRGAANGRESVTGRPLSFPLAIGQTWTANYTTPLIHARPGFARVRTTYTAADWEEVSTPAGVFRALKVDARGTIETHLASATLALDPGRTSKREQKAPHIRQSGQPIVQAVEHDAFYYAPRLKAFAKIVEEQFNEQAVRTSRDTQVLVSFTTPP